MRALVTGAAGFIGSHLSERLISDGHSVVGIDSFTEFYDRSLKEQNLEMLRASASFQLVDDDIAAASLNGVLEGCDFVFHLAGQPGVRGSWGNDFRVYVERNIWATQRLLESVRGRPLRKFVFASSSSVYGNASRYPTSEDDMPQPISPYGVSKLAAEQLCLAYGRSFGFPVVCVRFFTVYGPRQRPDMAFSRFIGALLARREIPLYGDGKQTRDFTYVGDAVAGTCSAATTDLVGEVVNIGGGARVTLLDAIRLLGEAVGQTPVLRCTGDQRGDMLDTGADISKAARLLNYRPATSLREGIAQQVRSQSIASRVHGG